MTDEERLLKEKYGGKRCFSFEADLGRLAAGEPLAYVIGHIPFLYTTIYLDSRPLIPRTETEFWVTDAIEDMKKREPREHGGHLRVLDLCAGSGCIGVAVAHSHGGTAVDFVEIDGKHYDTIYKNVVENDIDERRTNIFIGNLFDDIPHKYHFILSNPPYINPKADRSEDAVREHEPHVALYGGNAGMEHITEIITHAPDHLYDTGALYIEHEPEQTRHIHALGKKVGMGAQTHPDQYGLDRFTVLKRL